MKTFKTVLLLSTAAVLHASQALSQTVITSSTDLTPGMITPNNGQPALNAGAVGGLATGAVQRAGDTMVGSLTVLTNYTGSVFFAANRQTLTFNGSGQGGPSFATVGDKCTMTKNNWNSISTPAGQGEGDCFYGTTMQGGANADTSIFLGSATSDEQSFINGVEVQAHGQTVGASGVDVDYVDSQVASINKASASYGFSTSLSARQSSVVATAFNATTANGVAWSYFFRAGEVGGLNASTTIDGTGNLVTSGGGQFNGPLKSASEAVSGVATFNGPVQESSSQGITAATITAPASGTAPTGATALTLHTNFVVSCPSGSALQLPMGPAAGNTYEIVVVNRSGAACTLYPNSGGYIEASATNVAVNVANGGDTTFRSSSPTHWFQ